MCTRRSTLCLATVVLMVVGNGAIAQSTADLLGIRDAADKALNAHDLDAQMSYWADGCVYDFAPLPTPFAGKQAIRAFFEGLLAGFPDFATTEGRVWATGNMVVVEHIATGTHLGLWQGIPPTGNPIQMPHIDVYEFEGTKIRQVVTYGDMASVMMQLGVMPPAEMPKLVPSYPMPDPQPTGLSPVEAAREAQARFNDHDLMGHRRMQDPEDDIFVSPAGLSTHREGWGAIEELYFQAFPDLRVFPARFVDLGEGWVLCECTWAGTQTGAYFGVPASGVRSEVRGVILYRYDELGLEKAMHIYFDNMTVLGQITPKCPPTPPVPGCYVQDEITSLSLEGNLLGDPAKRPLLVHLPASYQDSPQKRYPTIYLLHGFLGDHTYFTSAGVYNVFAKAMAGVDLGADVDSVVTELRTSAQMGEAIIVMPNAINSLGGSVYERSPLIGDYRAYIAKDLVGVRGKILAALRRHPLGFPVYIP